MHRCSLGKKKDYTTGSKTGDTWHFSTIWIKPLRKSESGDFFLWAEEMTISYLPWKAHSTWQYAPGQPTKIPSTVTKKLILARNDRLPDRSYIPSLKWQEPKMVSLVCADLCANWTGNWLVVSPAGCKFWFVGGGVAVGQITETVWQITGAGAACSKISWLKSLILVRLGPWTGVLWDFSLVENSLLENSWNSKNLQNPWVTSFPLKLFECFE